MTVTKAVAEALSCHIRELHLEKSYRRIAREHFPGVAPGTLNRIAKEQGEWMPKDRTILTALGLIEAKPTPPEWLKRRKKAIAGMAKQTREALEVQG